LPSTVDVFQVVVIAMGALAVEVPPGVSANVTELGVAEIVKDSDIVAVRETEALFEVI
jgi:hypothetical protein